MEHAGEVPLLSPRIQNLHLPRRKPGLRAQVTIFFLLTGLVVSMSLSIITYAVARNYLISRKT